jgi:hypothetical protein
MDGDFSITMFHYQMVISCIQPASSKAFTADATLVERFPVTWETDQAEKRARWAKPPEWTTHIETIFFRSITSMMYAFYASSSLGTKLNLTFTSNLSSCIGIVGVQSSQTQLNLNLSLSLPLSLPFYLHGHLSKSWSEQLITHARFHRINILAIVCCSAYDHLQVISVLGWFN